MKDFNILGSLNYELRPENKIKPREVNIDPNRISWPYLKCSELKKDTSYTMRLLPSHPEKNPNGFVRKEMYQIPMELDMNPKNGWARHVSKYMTVPGCVGSHYKDPVKDILVKIYNLVKGASNYADAETGELKPDCDGPSDSDLFREAIENDDELRTYLSVISKTFVQNIMPVVLFATCETTKADGAKYSSFTNYLPDEGETEMLTRKFQMNDVKAFYDDKVGFVTKLRPKTEKDKKYVQWNHAEKGMNFGFTHTSSTPKAYLFEADPNGTSALPEEIAEKLELSDDNYPDLVNTELKNGLKDEATMLNLFLDSPYAEKLRPFGLLD